MVPQLLAYIPSRPARKTWLLARKGNGRLSRLCPRNIHLTGLEAPKGAYVEFFGVILAKDSRCPLHCLKIRSPIPL